MEGMEWVVDTDEVVAVELCLSVLGTGNVGQKAVAITILPKMSHAFAAVPAAQEQLWWQTRLFPHLMSLLPGTVWVLLPWPVPQVQVLVLFGGAPGGFGQGGFGGQQYGGAPSQYALPSGLGAPTGAYPPMGAGFGGGPFDDGRAAAAFSSAGNGPSGGPMNGSTNYTSGNGYEGSSHDDSFDFLQKGFGELSVGGDSSRRNGANSSKSPA